MLHKLLRGFILGWAYSRSERDVAESFPLLRYIKSTLSVF